MKEPTAVLPFKNGIELHATSGRLFFCGAGVAGLTFKAVMGPSQGCSE